jgi:N-acetylmuramoyl-L-alanine amidase
LTAVTPESFCLVPAGDPGIEMTGFQRDNVLVFVALMAAFGHPARVAAQPDDPPAPSATPVGFSWSLIEHDGRDHVTAADVAAFYRFDRFEQSGWLAWFRSPTLSMRIEVESPMLLVNDTRFLLSHPCVRRGGQVLISRVDLVKLLDPILRPGYLGKLPVFQTVVIDPGHGGMDNGTRGIYGDEKVFTLDLGLRLKSELESRGLKVITTRETDELPSKSRRAEIANALADAILISLHFNQSHSPAVQGLETYAMTPQGARSSNDRTVPEEARFAYAGNVHDSASLALATAIHAEILRQCRSEDRGIRRARWAVLKECQQPGVLIEGGFISHPHEAIRINSPDYRAHMAAAIADGVLNFRRAIRGP